VCNSIPGCPRIRPRPVKGSRFVACLSGCVSRRLRPCSRRLAHSVKHSASHAFTEGLVCVLSKASAHTVLLRFLQTTVSVIDELFTKFRQPSRVLRHFRQCLSAPRSEHRHFIEIQTCKFLATQFSASNVCLSFRSLSTAIIASHITFSASSLSMSRL